MLILVFLWKSFFEKEYFEKYDTVGLLLRSPTSLYVVNVKAGTLNVFNYLKIKQIKNFALKL